MTTENPYRTLHARMSPPGAAWDEGFAAGRAALPDERLREALELIRAHARLDLTERGIAEAERYAVIADDALTGSDLLASSTAEKLASLRKRSASASDPMPLCDCEWCARPLRDHDEEESG
mgnify:CR=1 FL=1